MTQLRAEQTKVMYQSACGSYCTHTY